MILPEEAVIFRSLPDIKVVFDVGARTDIDYYHYLPDCEYHLFEPHIEFIGELKANLRELKSHKIVINEFGLSDVEENKVYFEQTQSFLKDEGNYDIRNYPVKTLDWYCKDNDITKIDFLKIDAEAMDYKVLLGGQNIIQNTRYIQFEFGDDTRKYSELLKGFHLYLIMEPRLAKSMKQFTDKDFGLLTLVDNKINDLIIKVCETGAGGNILAINEN